jgi:hypothetical protein
LIRDLRFLQVLSGFPSVNKGTLMAVPDTHVNHCGKMPLGAALLSWLVIPTGTKGDVFSEHFRPRRRKVFSPDFEVEPGLKA